METDPWHKRHFTEVLDSAMIHVMSEMAKKITLKCLYYLQDDPKIISDDLVPPLVVRIAVNCDE